MDEDIRPNQQRSITNGDVMISVTEYGDANRPAVILLHGISNRSEAWLPIIPALAEPFRVLAMDLRGHGRSGHPVAGYRHSDYASDLQAVIADYNLADPLIVGHSLGGIVALDWAVEHPDVAAAIVAEDVPLSSGPGAEATFATWISMNQMPFEALLARYRADMPHRSEQQVRRRAEAMAGTASAVFHEELAAARSGATGDQTARLAGITSPVLLIHGDVETGGMVPPDDVRRFAETVPNGRTARIAPGTHWLHHDRPEDFLRLVVPFLEQHAPAR